MNKIKNIFLIILGILLGAGITYPLTNAYNAKLAGHKNSIGKFQAIEQLRQSADLVTTEVLVQKLAVYDSEKSEPISLVNPASWHIGERMCVIPVDVTLKYGFDLSSLSTANFHIRDNSLEVILPAPKLLDSGYGLLLDKNAYCYASSWGQSAGHKLQEQIRHQAYNEVLQDDILKIVHKDVVQNGELLFKSLLQSLGYDYVQVVVKDEKN